MPPGGSLLSRKEAVACAALVPSSIRRRIDLAASPLWIVDDDRYCARWKAIENPGHRFCFRPFVSSATVNDNGDDGAEHRPRRSRARFSSDRVSKMHRARAFFLAILLTVSLPVSAVSARQVVSYAGNEEPGSIVIRTKDRRLYLVLEDGTAIQYRVAVGRSAKQWVGAVEIEGKYIEPAWSPPDEIRRDNPRLPDVIAGGAPNNPMGARAMTLSGGGQYAIHGTNRPESIGTFASYGCFRMLNEDIIDLFGRVSVGTPVIVRR